MNTELKNYKVYAENRLRSYCYWYRAIDRKDAIQQFLKEKNKRKSFFSKINASIDKNRVTV
jgi:hypothetical protein